MSIESVMPSTKVVPRAQQLHWTAGLPCLGNGGSPGKPVGGSHRHRDRGRATETGTSGGDRRGGRSGDSGRRAWSCKPGARRRDLGRRPRGPRERGRARGGGATSGTHYTHAPNCLLPALHPIWFHTLVSSPVNSQVLDSAVVFPLSRLPHPAMSVVSPVSPWPLGQRMVWPYPSPVPPDLNIPGVAVMRRLGCGTWDLSSLTRD